MIQLCTSAEFKSWGVNQRQKYLDEIYGDAPHIVYGRIKVITPAVVIVEVTHFVISGKLIEFKLFSDATMHEIGATGFLDKLPKNYVLDYCREKRIAMGDIVTCEIYPQSRNLEYLLTFFLKSLNNNDDFASKTYDVEVFNPNFDAAIDYWQRHLHFVYGLDYEQDILKSVYFGLQTDKLILLAGNPGTGKTSLVKHLAKSFNFVDAEIIAVQSGWTDKSDLLGYYNPLDKNYVSTKFLDALIKFCRQAVNKTDKLFIICLDEMNLSRVEYYFAEFLSALQTDRIIQLYSDYLLEDIRYELNNSRLAIDIRTLPPIERKYYFELYRMSKMIERYPANFKIPDNVKFFGTLNQDETTLDISPKVIDRSYVIRLEMSDVKINKNLQREDYKNPLKYQPLENYNPTHNNYLPFDADNFERELQSITHTSRRVTNQILRSDNWSAWENVLGRDTLKDFIIASCILPKIRLDADDFNDKIFALESLCKDFPISKNILSRINTGDEIDFWRSR